MTYPSLEQYNNAFQVHSKLLTDPELQRGVVSTTSLGLPLAISGGFALTYTIKCGSKKYAVRCFHRKSRELEKRYSAISKRIASLSSRYFLDFRFQSDGIRVNGGKFPIVKMAWAKGETLGEFLENNRHKAQALANLESAVQGLAIFLEKEQIAHGDLQTGNLMVSDDGRDIQLIDYDGMYVDEIKALGSDEAGHINFQHPERRAKNPFGPRLDRFSLISLALALKAMRVNPNLWDKTRSELDAIIFRANDFIDPSSSTAFALLMAEKSLVADTRNFAAVCKAPLEKTPSLADFLAGKNIPALQIELADGRPLRRSNAGYLGVYDVLDGSRYGDCLAKVGDKVEVVGQIEKVDIIRPKAGRPYLFVNFGNWQGTIFKIAIWSDAYAALSNLPNPSWKGKWISVVGLMQPPFHKKTDKYEYTHVAISVNANGQMIEISEAEAKWRLAGPQPVAANTSSNQNLIEKIRKTHDPSSATVPMNAPASTAKPASPKPATSNQAIINKIRAAQQQPSTTVPPTIQVQPQTQRQPPPPPPPPRKAIPSIQQGQPQRQQPSRQPEYIQRAHPKKYKKGFIGRLIDFLLD